MEIPQRPSEEVFRSRACTLTAPDYTRIGPLRGGHLNSAAKRTTLSCGSRPESPVDLIDNDYRMCPFYWIVILTSDPAMKAALTWTVAVPFAASGGTRKFTW